MSKKSSKEAIQQVSALRNFFNSEGAEPARPVGRAITTIKILREKNRDLAHLASEMIKTLLMARNEPYVDPNLREEARIDSGRDICEECATDCCTHCGSDQLVRITPMMPGPDGWGYRCKACGKRWYSP